MIFGVQILGILFGLVMIYFTFLYYKKANYDKVGLAFWFCVWIGFMILVMFPTIVYGVMDALKIERTADFFYVSGFLLFSVVLFYVYNLAKKNQQQLEVLVRTLAIKKADKPNKRRK